MQAGNITMLKYPNGHCGLFRSLRNLRAGTRGFLDAYRYSFA